jgi:hypothetical protein
VSLPWNKSLRLCVAPDRISATLRVGWPRAAAVTEAQRHVEPDEATTSAPGGTGGHDLSGHPRAIDALLQ